MSKNTLPYSAVSEDLVSELEYKLSDIEAHIKFLSNSTSEHSDFEINFNDINLYSLTLHDKAVSALSVLQKLRNMLENID